MFHLGSSTSLVDLGYDVIHLILSSIRDDRQHSDLLSISVVSKALRTCTLPLLFGDVAWPREDTPEFYPSEIWVYIRRVRLVEARWTSGLQHEIALDILSQVLPKLPNLSTFSYTLRAQPPSLAFILSLINHNFTSLTSLHLSTSFLARDYSCHFVNISRMQEIVIKYPERSTSLYAAPESKRLLSMECAANLISGSRETLVHLDVPGEYFSLPTFAAMSGDKQFPALKRLVLRGYPPEHSERYPIWTVLSNMPRLSVLEVCCKLRMIGVVPHRYVLMPTDPQILPKQDQSLPPFLKTLVICNPSLTDNILRRLPSSLQCLVLDFVPYWDVMNTGSDLLAYHNPEKLVRLLRALHAAGDSMPHLEHLRINMGWCVTPELLRRISIVFPGLHILEFQGIRYFHRESHDFESNLDLFTQELSKFSYLHTLKLAVELKEDSYKEDGCLRKIGSVDESSQLWANTLARRVLGLKRIAFEHRRHTGKTIGSRSIVGEPLWVWYFLNRFPDEEGNIMRRADEAVDWDLLDKSFRW
ncbi:hypothetical protein E1B28_007570 [Marasmius oreades]|uniref:Uncharacterized protein n=1 Tax=Marasmius oreades TaxID=181124 RepID=A0A9P7S3B3_9AGAR|nr:uncharacterized protein E1B28_007570 [Marasmius oreades]KAG7093936.1 hypothetical protein E1B28_007570 [Marasmius oreades]